MVAEKRESSPRGHTSCGLDLASPLKSPAQKIDFHVLFAAERIIYYTAAGEVKEIAIVKFNLL